eukprot:3465003-Amphidinium_carterae.2
MRTCKCTQRKIHHGTSRKVSINMLSSLAVRVLHHQVHAPLKPHLLQAFALHPKSIQDVQAKAASSGQVSILTLGSERQGSVQATAGEWKWLLLCFALLVASDDANLPMDYRRNESEQQLPRQCKDVENPEDGRAGV